VVARAKVRTETLGREPSSVTQTPPVPAAVPAHILPTIVAATFAGTSLWFSGNAVFPDLQVSAGYTPAALGQLTIAVQIGFIVGTLVFAMLSLADRFSPSLVFLLSTVAGAGSNAAVVATDAALWPMLVSRFGIGFFLAGIYPVGMKIAASWFERDLGRALGFMIGALVLGTAFPHLIRALGGAFPWQFVLLVVSAFAVCGGLAMYLLVPNGPFSRPGARFAPRAVIASFRSADFRASAGGYFGHMWELYVFWAFVPLFIAAHPAGPSETADVAFWAFVLIAAGAIGCMGGGLLSGRLGSARVAFVQLSVSGVCCLLSPLAFLAPFPVAVAFLFVWGIVVAGDSPQFSALNARYAPQQFVGSALTIVNCIGFAISILALAVIGGLETAVGLQYLFLFLVPGPILGLWALRRLAQSLSP
jgi:MFS family permease